MTKVTGPGDVMGSRSVPVTLRRGPSSERHEEMPQAGSLIDRYGRMHTDLRVSVTDRCNLRCIYCLPEDGVEFRPREEILSFEEIARLANIAKGLGVKSLRITGGEPLLRRNISELVRQISAVGFDDLSMTTNGMLLSSLADTLAEAGLRRVNISCDSLRPERYSKIRRRGNLQSVLDSMAAAESAGLGPLKVNVVVIAGVNDDEIMDFAAFARSTGRVVRFIEYMPLGAEHTWRPDQVVAGEEIVDRISSRWQLRSVSDPSDISAPASRFEFIDGAGEVGVISSVTKPFCSSCNRLRLTADGSLRNCLFSDDEISVRELLRSGASDFDVEMAFRRSVWGKHPGHGIHDPGFVQPSRSMSMIGG